MNIVLFDDSNRDNLLPLSFTRPVSLLRVGILTIKEKWERRLEGEYSFLTPKYLSKKFPEKFTFDDILINGAVCPNQELVRRIGLLSEGKALKKGNTLIAVRLKGEVFDEKKLLENAHEFPGDITIIQRPYHIFLSNSDELEKDFDLITSGRESAPISSTNTILGDRIFAEHGAKAECATFNTTSGAIYLGKDSTVMEGSVIRGGLAMCESSTLKLSTKVYGATTVGPHSKVGGEVNNSVITGYSNKGHDGFLGNSVLGEWCNIGADTNNSNLKNNYDEVKIWNYTTGRFERTGQQFCGLIMGDHSKSGINTMFNTGTVVGVSANIFGGGFPRVFVPSFSWGGASGFTEYKLQKALDTGERMMSRRGIELDEIERDIMQHIFDKTADYRKNF